MNARQTVSTLQEFAQEALEAGDKDTAQTFFDEIQRFADENNLKIKIDVETGEVTIDEETYEQAQEKLGFTHQEKALDRANKDYQTKQEAYEDAQQNAGQNGMDTGSSAGMVDYYKQQADSAGQYYEIMKGIVEESGNADSELSSVLTTLSTADMNSLDNIVFGDHKPTEGLEQYESAIDSLLDHFGLG